MGIFVHSATDTNTTGAGRDMIACCNYDLIREIVTIPQTNNTTIFLLYIQTKLPGESSQGSVRGQCHLTHLTILGRFSWPNLACMCTEVA